MAYLLKRDWIVAATVLLMAGRAFGQDAVVVGKGSYAASPPPLKNLGAIENKPVYLVHPDGRPIPSNKWWTQLVVSKFAKSLWSIPLRVDTSEQGLDICFPVAWAKNGNDPECELPLRVGGANFHPTDSRAKNWADWLVSFRLGESADRYIDVTLGEGMPYVWAEYHGVSAEVTFPKDVQPELFDLQGATLLPHTGDCIGIAYEHRQYGVLPRRGAHLPRRPGEFRSVLAGRNSS